MKTPDEARSRTMRAVKGKDTQPELTVRRLLHRAGYRYRLHVKDLPGKPDLVFPSWHGHRCPRGDRQPKANADYWSAKIERNRAATSRTWPRAGGWKVLTVWECELKGRNIEGRLTRFLDK